MPSQLIKFTGSMGAQLAGKLDAPDNIIAYALFGHCFTGGKDLTPIRRMVQELNNEGIAVFRFDFTGIGKSEGNFENTNFSSNVDDLLAAAEYMRQNFSAPKLLFGHSLGGTAALVAATEIPEVKAVATIGAPFNTVNVFKQFAQQLRTIKKEGEAVVKLGGRDFTIKKQFLDDAKDQDIKCYIEILKRPLLILHSPVDKTVPIEHARCIYDAAHHPKSFISLDKADHLLMENPKDSEYIAKVLAAWSAQYIQ